MSLVAILAVIFGLKQFAQDGIGWPPLFSMALGLAIGALFVRRQRRLDDPLIDLGLFRVPTFTSSLFLYGFGILMVFGGFLFVPQYLQLVLGLSPLEGRALDAAMGARVRRRLPGDAEARTAVRADDRSGLAAGLALAALGVRRLHAGRRDDRVRDDRDRLCRVLPRYRPRLHADERPDDWVGPPERSRCRRRISETTAESGGALGIAFFGSIGVALYRNGVAEGIPAIPPGERGRRAGHARRRGRGSGQLPAELAVPPRGRERCVPQRDAIVAVISVVGTLALAAFTATVLRRRAGSGAGGGNRAGVGRSR